MGTNGAAELMQLASAMSLADSDMESSPLSGLEHFAGNVLLWCGSRVASPSGKDGVAARLAAWRALLPAATLRPLITTRAPWSLVPEDDPGALRAALLSFVA